jgi:phospholipase D1/2
VCLTLHAPSRSVDHCTAHSIPFHSISHAGRLACRYIYIENQYFLGSCYLWKDEQESGCSHSVVAELVKRIVSKIRKGLEFTAYIVRPSSPAILLRIACLRNPGKWSVPVCMLA